MATSTPGSGGSPHVRIGVLGPVTLERDGIEVPCRSGQVRTFLSQLVLQGTSVPNSEVQKEALWPVGVPPSADHGLANLAHRLRALLGVAEALTWRDTGYHLDPDAYSDDRRDFDTAASRAMLAARHLDAATTLDAAGRALELWRGEPWAELGRLDLATFDRERLIEVHLVIEDLECEALLREGHVQEASVRLAATTVAEPYRERRWWLRAIALYRDSQRRASLNVLNHARLLLVDVGLEPGVGLKRLEDMILTDEPSLRGPGLPGDTTSER